jgi:hypothetical protein
LFMSSSLDPSRPCGASSEICAKHANFSDRNAILRG